MSWVWQHSTSEGIDRLVLLAIADAADDDGGNAWPSVATLARKTRVDPRTVQRAVRRLVAVGELTMRPNAGRNGVNVYRVTMTPGATPPLAHSHPRQNATPGRTPPPAQRRPGTQSPNPRHSATQPVLNPPTNSPTSKGSPTVPPGALARTVRAYVESATLAGVPTPESAQTRVQRSARALLTEGYPLEDILDAARNAAIGGWTDLATQLQRDAARASPTSTPGGSTADRRTAQSIDAGRAVAAELAQLDTPERRQLA